MSSTLFLISDCYYSIPVQTPDHPPTKTFPDRPEIQSEASSKANPKQCSTSSSQPIKFIYSAGILNNGIIHQRQVQKPLCHAPITHHPQSTNFAATLVSVDLAARKFLNRSWLMPRLDFGVVAGPVDEPFLPAQKAHVAHVIDEA